MDGFQAGSRHVLKSPTKLFAEKTALIDSNAVDSGHTTTILMEIHRRSRCFRSPGSSIP
ncbi:hypothetical protein RMSM_01001 [Rhodopirellula maiorica SM1]|uniref:Uncharacterized protein n=1 Tax=Rhodopirellula maiorica SM1 TaxID=1265738 RepID=M5RS02_9BACT|nr:hypothetical protein RMSM_01001 [Rhodopirellula maiorica SM1]